MENETNCCTRSHKLKAALYVTKGQHGDVTCSAALHSLRSEIPVPINKTKARKKSHCIFEELKSGVDLDPSVCGLQGAGG